MATKRSLTLATLLATGGMAGCASHPTPAKAIQDCEQPVLVVQNDTQAEVEIYRVEMYRDAFGPPDTTRRRNRRLVALAPPGRTEIPVIVRENIDYKWSYRDGSFRREARDVGLTLACGSA